MIEQFNDFMISDLIRPNTTYTFVLESPHTTELETRIIATGNTGTIMSKALLNNNTPFGNLISSGNGLVSNFSLMNSARFPLQTSIYSKKQILSEVINTISLSREYDNTNTYNYKSHKQGIKDAFNSVIGNEILNDFKNRFDNTILACNKFIICGIVAQAIFEKSLNISGCFHRAVSINYRTVTIDIFYENHPSPISGDNNQSKWMDQNNITKLRNFIGIYR